MRQYRDAVKSGMTEYLSELKTKVENLSAVELRWQATLETNNILWLVWHMADVEDSWINEAIGGNETVWDSSGWSGRTGINIENHFGDKGIEGVRSMPDVEMKTLIEYFDEVRQATFKVIDRVSDQDLANETSRKVVGRSTHIRV